MVKSYRDLVVWQKAIEVVEDIYRITSGFPKDELYGLTSQLRRAAVSIPSNIAEGSSRRSTKEYVRFINIASGSMSELETQIVIAHRLGFINKNQIEALEVKTDEIGKMLFALQRALNEKLAA